MSSGLYFLFLLIVRCPPEVASYEKIENKIMLITYANTLGGSLAQLERVLAQYFPGAFGGIHILPFFPRPATKALP